MPIQQMLLGGGAAVEPPGQVTFTSTGSHTWTVPAGVTSVSVVCIGSGGESGYDGGGGGALAYGNNISVTPGASISLQVGAVSTGTARHSYFVNSTTLQGGGASATTGGTSQGNEKDGGGNGGDGGTHSSWGAWKWGAGGGGTAGYTGDGADGANSGAAADSLSDGAGAVSYTHLRAHET